MQHYILPLLQHKNPTKTLRCKYNSVQKICPMENGLLRLRVAFTGTARFYTCIRPTASLEDLKKLILKILEKRYGYTAGRFTLESEDGYELLDDFPVGSMLSDNQVVVINLVPYGLSRLPAQAISSKPVVREEVKENKAEVGSMVSFYKNKMGYLQKRDSEKKQLEETTKMVSRSPKRARAGKEPVPAAQEKREFLKTDEVSTAAVLEKQAVLKTNEVQAPAQRTQPDKTTEIVKKPAPALIKTSITPPSSEFRGFAVYKKDLDNNKSSDTFSQTIYKPLKKKKSEEIFEEI